MTLIEIRNQIFSFFIKNTTFSFSKDLSLIKVAPEQEDNKEDLLRIVFEGMETDNLLRIVKDEKGKIQLAVLNSPWNYDGQKVVLGNQTAELIGEIINQWRDANEIRDGLVDKLNITEFDIQTLIGITADLLNGHAQEEEEE
jgi:hypothetical protein